MTERYEMYNRCFVCCGPFQPEGTLAGMVAIPARPRRCLDCAVGKRVTIYDYSFPIPMSEWFPLDRVGSDLSRRALRQ